MYVCMYVYVCICVYIYIYIYNTYIVPSIDSIMRLVLRCEGSRRWASTDKGTPRRPKTWSCPKGYETKTPWPTALDFVFFG